MRPVTYNIFVDEFVIYEFMSIKPSLFDLLQVNISVYVLRETHVAPQKWRTSLVNRVNRTLRISLMKLVMNWGAPLFPDIKGLMVSLLFPLILHSFLLFCLLLIVSMVIHYRTKCCQKENQRIETGVNLKRITVCTSVALFPPRLDKIWKSH